MTDDEVNTPEGEARRALVLHDRPLVVDLITLTLTHGGFVVRAAGNLAEAEAILAAWSPNMTVVDMDHDDSTALLKLLGASNTPKRSALPVLGLTRRGDLKMKLRAFDLGVDDILTMPFSPEELLARAIVISRRATGIDPPFIPVIKLGEIEMDIFNRVVRAGDSEIHMSRDRAEPALPAREPGRERRDEGRDPRCHLGTRLCGGEQHRGPPHPGPAHQASGRLAAAALHRHGPRRGLSLRADLLEIGMG